MKDKKLKRLKNIILYNKKYIIIYMDIELINYKNQKIQEATNSYNNNLRILNNQLNTSIRLINISRRVNKRQLLSNVINDYNNKLNVLKNNLKNTINSINSLTNIPGRIIITNNPILVERKEPSKFGLLIGINYNNTPNQLYGCINDANNIKNLLTESYNYNTNNIILLTDNTSKKPTKSNILNELNLLLENSISGDKIFLFYSGHGTNFFDTNNDELDGQDEAIVPLDATNKSTCILDDELNNILKTKLKENVAIFSLFDCCHSGTILDLKFNYLDGNNNDIQTINNLVQETKGKIIMISGCKDNQVSMDSVINNQNTGALTYAFLQTLKNYNNENIKCKILLDSIRYILKENNYEQIPQLSSGTLIDINNENINL